MTPLVGVTLGDPAGIGPELVARALDAPPEGVTLRVYGDRGVLEEAAARLGLRPRWDGVDLVEVTQLEGAAPGRPSEAGARAQLAYLERAIADARARAIASLCTAPIHKAACKAVGFDFPGHTELLAARLSDVGQPLPVTMMLAGPRLRVALATTHLALSAVPAALASGNGEAIERAIVHAAEGLSAIFGIARPRVAVAGLNPHAGERGHFGDDEPRVIAPAIARAQARLGDRALVSGPHVPDAVFRDAVAGLHDAVVALYHDQGLVPVKLIDFEDAVNVTLGLPIVRTSPDHGVAYDIAGTGKARPTSFDAALRLAVAAARRA
jgi:4-hydroxythreonine-4-phosphate dehydrogenase